MLESGWEENQEGPLGISLEGNLKEKLKINKVLSGSWKIRRTKLI